jgi:hypothetical protein
MFFFQVPLFELFVEALMVTSIEAPFTLLQKPVKTNFVNPVEFT